MENFKPKNKPYAERRNSGDFNREGSGRPSSNPFEKDKRPRTQSTYERVPRERKPMGENPEGDDQQRPRRSFNPNFTSDNRFRGDGRGDQRTDRKPFGDRPQGEGFKKEGFRKDGFKKEGFKKEGFGGGNKYGNNKFKGKPGPKKEFKPKYDKDNYPKFAPASFDKPMRLNRFIAQSGMCSRREADEFITAGVVTVNGQVVSEMGSKVMPSDEVRFNGEVMHGEKKVYIVMNKPKGYVTTIEDPHADKTVMDLVRGACNERVYPVGRLDKNSLGVLLITNDGDLTKKLTHTIFAKKKIYQVSLDKPLTRADLERLVQGLELEDGPIAADEANYVKENHKEIGIEIHSGRNRIVRRMFESMGYKVTKLDRVYFAGLTKKNLKRGAWRFLTPREVSILKSGAFE